MMVLYEITVAPLAEELIYADTILFSPFYANDEAFDGLARRSTAQLKIPMDQGPYRGYLHKPAKYIFITDNPEDKEATNREFKRV